MNIAILLSEMYRDYLAVQADELEIPNADLRGLCYFVSPWLEYRFPHIPRNSDGISPLYGKMRKRQRSLFRQSGLCDVFPFHYSGMREVFVNGYPMDVDRIMADRLEWVRAHLDPQQCESRTIKVLNWFQDLGGRITRKQ